MNIFNNMKSFLYEQNYSINLYNNKLYIFNYILLPKFNDKEINVKFEKFNIAITGKNLKITKMEKKELLIEGIINNINFNYE